MEGFEVYSNLKCIHSQLYSALRKPANEELKVCTVHRGSCENHKFHGYLLTGKNY